MKTDKGEIQSIRSNGLDNTEYNLNHTQVTPGKNGIEDGQIYNKCPSCLYSFDFI